uniref:Uncharacterized protein n=1 Tax=Heterorhabditis bacteriophora TaxID=37862 RepID=A0A1I7XDZ1_HETBA
MNMKSKRMKNGYQDWEIRKKENYEDGIKYHGLEGYLSQIHPSGGKG